jgi:hypothetical protein
MANGLNWREIYRVTSIRVCRIAWVVDGFSGKLIEAPGRDSMV